MEWIIAWFIGFLAVMVIAADNRIAVFYHLTLWPLLLVLIVYTKILRWRKP